MSNQEHRDHRSARHERRLDSIWERPEPGSRRPRHTREQIANAALAIADREGFDAVSMRRVASELGAGTMTLYHYVRNKDELVDLMDDAIMGEVLIPAGELPKTWREAIAAIARRSRAVFLRHPWALQALDGARGGPNGMRHFEQSLAAVASLDIDARAKFELIAMVDDYVFGFVFRAGAAAAAFEATGHEEIIEELLPHFEAQIRSGEYPHIEALFAGGDVRETWQLVVQTMIAESRFELGLERLLDGIAAGLER
jgi:AcrR family transcriptional regulator